MDAKLTLAGIDADVRLAARTKAESSLRVAFNAAELAIKSLVPRSKDNPFGNIPDELRASLNSLLEDALSLTLPQAEEVAVAAAHAKLIKFVLDEEAT